MKTAKFKPGKWYHCPDLYGGNGYNIQIVKRNEEENTVSFLYSENTSDDRTVQTATIEKFTVEQGLTGRCEPYETEAIMAWEYQSPYAKKGDTDKGYFTADEGKSYENIDFDEPAIQDEESELE